MSKDIAVQAAEMLAAAGATEIGVYQEMSPPGLGIHEMGTARMGRDPKTSVLNEHNQAHDVKNLFLTGRRLHGFVFVRQSVAHVHGVDARALATFAVQGNCCRVGRPEL